MERMMNEWITNVAITQDDCCLIDLINKRVKLKTSIQKILSIHSVFCIWQVQLLLMPVTANHHFLPVIRFNIWSHVVERSCQWTICDPLPGLCQLSNVGHWLYIRHSHWSAIARQEQALHRSNQSPHNLIVWPLHSGIWLLN